MTFFEVEYRKDKVTIAQYGMVLCLVTLTDLQARRAGLLASAELLVFKVLTTDTSHFQVHVRSLCKQPTGCSLYHQGVLTVGATCRPVGVFLYAY